MSALNQIAYRSRLTDQDINLSTAARAKFAELLAEETEVNAIRVFVAGGGCGGMRYGMTFTDTNTEFDAVYEGDGFMVYIDSVALGYLRGIEIDFVDRPGGASFVFRNAFAATGGSGACGGCGSSGGGCA